MAGPAHRRPAPAVLLDDNDEITPALEAALRAIFARFDADKDGYLNVTELQAFAVATNDREFDQDTLDQIQEFFADDAKLPEIMLAVDGFMDMYHLQTQSDEAETRKDLHRLGFDDQLKPVVTSTPAAATAAPSSSS
ncbi:hypothetical protein AMAG_17159 [Allomyces macrogynus ATCC 38327]|uniref:EF-hand domain-containing protein n=1 Tax=Allomyces macrogynus (strain ATCC 38327) TaxID=578462 RepID=A0A0L0TEB0_ALLM3|nr:hypothetical protein AMAG_17159 [Allomyces macrogynus ATCC 38327]|eukprot:KNE72924.1 hypothetical protein AMAG_17159 [Allomyces macrogynus ATCC 38327]